MTIDPDMHKPFLNNTKDVTLPSSSSSPTSNLKFSEKSISSTSVKLILLLEFKIVPFFIIGKNCFLGTFLLFTSSESTSIKKVTFTDEGD